MAASSAPIARRHVLFLPGFDPSAPRAFRERYRREATRQSDISGYEITVTADPGRDPNAWQVAARIDGQETRTEIELLAWADLVRNSMRRGIGASYLGLVRTAWIYISTGALWRLMQLRKGPVIAALYPVAALLLQLLLALLTATVVARVVALVPGNLSAALGWIAGIGLGLWLIDRFRRWDGVFLAHYLMHDYAFSAGQRGAYPADLEARLSAFSDRVASALEGEAEEVLVVGHSSGAYLAVSVLADLLRDGRVPAGRTLSLLTLGQVVPMVSFLPDAGRLRADLACLAVSERITWVDVTAPGDGCAFALCDPVSVTGVAPEGKRWPLVISAAFSQTLAPETWAKLRWRFFEAHFQYLNAFDRPGDYDYFAITAGPLSLGERFAGRAPSASRIETPVNRYRSLGP